MTPDDFQDLFGLDDEVDLGGIKDFESIIAALAGAGIAEELTDEERLMKLFLEGGKELPTDEES